MARVQPIYSAMYRVLLLVLVLAVLAVESAPRLNFGKLADVAIKAMTAPCRKVCDDRLAGNEAALLQCRSDCSN